MKFGGDFNSEMIGLEITERWMEQCENCTTRLVAFKALFGKLKAF